MLADVRHMSTYIDQYFFNAALVIIRYFLSLSWKKKIQRNSGYFIFPCGKMPGGSHNFSPISLRLNKSKRALKETSTIASGEMIKEKLNRHAPHPPPPPSFLLRTKGPKKAPNEGNKLSESHYGPGKARI